MKLLDIFKLPDDWTGALQVRGCVDLADEVVEVEEADADFFGVYAQTSEGFHMWVQDFDSRAQAVDVVRILTGFV